MIMNDVKNWYQSKSIWGGIITVLAVLLGAFGYTLTGDDQAALVEIVSAIVGAIGGLLAIYGRVKASKTVK